jgi:hypothetical protein
VLGADVPNGDTTGVGGGVAKPNEGIPATAAEIDTVAIT